MELVRAIANSDLRDLTLVSYGGPDVGLLCATGQVKKVVYGFVSLDSIPLEPWFRKARQSASVEVTELDEGMFLLGLQAAAWRLPFLPTRAGLGSDIMTVNPELKTVRSPYSDAEELVAMPALRLDAALVHLNRGDATGNAAYLGPDPYFDDLFLGAADLRIVSVERVVDTEELVKEAGLQRLLVNRSMTDLVVEARGGAGFTQCLPDYPRDEAAQRAYAATAKDAAVWDSWRKNWLEGA